jgi:hypothetical protein
LLFRDDNVLLDVAEAIISEGLLTPAAALSEFLNTAVFLGPLRDIPARRPSQDAKSIESHWASGSAAWQILRQSDDELISKVNAWISGDSGLKLGYRVEVSKYRELPVDSRLSQALAGDSELGSEELRRELRSLPINSRVDLVRSDGVKLAFSDVGVGLSQALPIIVAAMHTSRGVLSAETLISVEQPELHLHPAVQGDFADLFLFEAIKGHKLFLIETHSEHLMLRCLRRVRESAKGLLPDNTPAVAPEDIAVHFIEATTEGPKVKRIEIDEEGDFIDEWPGGFFEESFNEKFAGR